MRVLHAGPAGAYSDDGTIELLERWRVPVEFTAIDEGFGAIRTRAIRSSPCDWVMLLDADERFHRHAEVLTCEGESTPPQDVDDLLYDYGNPDFDRDGMRNKQVVQGYDKSIDFGACPSNFENMALLGAKLRVRAGELYDQGKVLREIISQPDIDAVRVIRRHRHDLGKTRPTQNWHTDPDWQIRTVRNNGQTGWDPGSRMHERVVGVKNAYAANHRQGPFFEHFHIFFKRQEVDQRRHDIAIYNAIGNGAKPPTWEEYRK